MGCNCGKKKVLNNLHLPSYVQLAKDFLKSIEGIPVESLDEFHYNEMYGIYNQIFPNSNGQPNREEILQIIINASNYKSKR